MCLSPSVEKVTRNSENALEQVHKLEAQLNAEYTEKENIFQARISDHLTKAKISDQRLLEANHGIKTEYSSEFSLDKIAAVVKAGIAALKASKDPKVPDISPNDTELEAYTALVDSVAEAAKSSSGSVSSLSFSMTRLGPGIYAFLQAYSMSIKDDALFGTESVTSTCIQYAFYQSIQDVASTARFGAALADEETVLKWKKLQTALVDDVANGKLTPEEYDAKDRLYQGFAQRAQERLDGGEKVSNRFVVTQALKKLRSRPGCAGLVQELETRLKYNYY